MTQKYEKVVTGEFYWKGNLEKLIQHTEVKVLPPTMDLTRDKPLPAKIVIESWLEDRDSKQERDHFSIRVSSIGEFFSMFAALVLALRVYLKYIPYNKILAYNNLVKKIKEVWQGQYDHMIRR